MGPLMRVAILVLPLAASACQGPRPPDRPVVPKEGNRQDQRENALQVSTEVTPVGAAIEGELGLVHLKLRNVSRTYCLFLKSVHDADGGMSYHWQFSRGGRMEYRKGEDDEYVHDRLARDPVTEELLETEPIFNQGFLAPAVEGPDGPGGRREFQDELELNLSIRLIRLPRALKVEYFAFTREEVMDKVFLPTLKADRYARPTQAYLDEYIRLRHLSVHQGVFRKEHFVYPAYPHGPFVPVMSTRMLVSLQVQKRGFPLAEAAARAELSERELRDYSYSLTYDAWLLKGPDGRSRLVDRNGSTPVGRADFHFFFLQDLPSAPRTVGRDLVEVVLTQDTEQLFRDVYTLDRSKPKEERLIGVIYPVNTREKRGSLFRERVEFVLILKKQDFRGFLKECGVYDLTLSTDSGGRAIVGR
jgi:hypothetical protein